MTISWVGLRGDTTKIIVATILAVIASIIVSVCLSRPTYAADAHWEGNTLKYTFDYNLIPSDSQRLNSEVRDYINEKRPLGHNDIAWAWTYYQWDENSDCRDVIAFPPGEDPKKATRAEWIQVDHTILRGCTVVNHAEISIEPAGTTKDNPGDPNRPEIPNNNNTEPVERCEVQWIGFIVCWVSRVIGWTIQGTFTILEKLMYIAPISNTNDGGKEIYRIWQVFRNIANVVFIITLLIVVLSQVTTAFLDNYGVKKILPRLVVGVLLINASYWICAAAVDASNILGNSLYAILKNIAVPVAPQVGPLGDSIILLLTAGAGVFIYMNILALAPLLISGIFAIFMTVVILIIRQAIVIMFVVISPIAFALNILPSTQKWFNKWWSSFLTILMIFPMVGIVYGGTQVLAGVMALAVPPGSNDLVRVVFAVFSLAVQILPFFTLPILMKVSGRLLTRITGMVNNPSKGVFDRAKGGVSRWADDKERLRETNALTGKTKIDPKTGGAYIKRNNGLYAAAKRRKNRNDTIADEHESQLKDPNKGAYGSFMNNQENRSKVAKAVGKNAGNRRSDDAFAGAGPLSAAGRKGIDDRIAALEAQSENVHMELELEHVSAAEAFLENQQYDLDELRRAAETGNGKGGDKLTEDEQAAARSLLAKNSTLDDVHKLIDQVQSEGASAKMREALVRGIAQNPNAKGAAHLDSAGLDAIRKGPTDSNPSGGSVSNLYSSAVARQKYNPERVANESSAALKGLLQHMNTSDGSANYDAAGLAHLRKSIDTVRSETKYSDRVSSKSNHYLSGIR